MRFDRVAVALLVTGVASVGCHSYRAIDPMTGETGTVRVSWTSPRTVAVRAASGSSVPADNVTHVTGRIDHIAADTVFVRVEDIRGPDGIIAGVPRGGIAAIVREPAMRMERQRFSMDRTLGLLLGGSALVFGLLLYFNGEEDVVY
jgi:hypothetical protein